MRKFSFFLIPLLLLLAACTQDVSKEDEAKTEVKKVAGVSVKGEYGKLPVLSFPKTKAPTELEKTVLKAGTGVEVEKNDLLIADYVGQVWQGEIFDQSFDKPEPAGFTIGTGEVIKGWDESLVGVKKGSRVLLVVPPSKGYGTEGNSNANIKGTDAIVFVIDVLDSIKGSQGADPSAKKMDISKNTKVEVKGEIGKRPAVNVPAGTNLPDKVGTFILAKGSGALVESGSAVLQYEVQSWQNQKIESTWETSKPVNVQVTKGGTGPLDTLVGVPIGSRVVLEIPNPQGETQAEQPAAVVAVVDVVAQVKR